MLDKSAWKERLAPHLSVSLRDVSDRITNQSDVQAWLHEASFRAAEGLAQMQTAQAEAEGYMRMMTDLEETFPDLVDAVADLTDGCGQLDLHWRPLTPSFSRLYVHFEQEIDPVVFCRMDGDDPPAARRVIETVADALPKGDPFPNRPNEAPAVVSVKGHCFGLQVEERLAEGANRTVRSVTLFPPSGQPIEELTVEDAARRIAGAIQ